MALQRKFSMPPIKLLTKDIFRIFLVCLLLHHFVFAYFCSTWHYSTYFSYQNLVEDLVEIQNVERQTEAEEYFDHLSKELSSLFYSKVNEKKLKILIVVLTVKRSRRDYLLQTMAGLDKQVKDFHMTKPGSDNNLIGLVVCNANSYPESHTSAQHIKKFIPVLTIKEDQRSDRCCSNKKCHLLEPKVKEKVDYGSCTRIAIENFDSEHLLVIQDDAVPQKNAIKNIIKVLNERLSDERHRDQWIQAKLFYPANYRGFEATLESIVELVAFITLIATPLYLIYSKIYIMKPSSIPRMTIVFVLIWSTSLIFCFALGRQNTITTLRQRFLPYSLRPAPSGSLTSVLYCSRAFEKYLLNFLVHETKCDSGPPLDFEIHDYIMNHVPLNAFLVEGNYFEHIGHFSSLGGVKELQPQIVKIKI